MADEAPQRIHVGDATLRLRQQDLYQGQLV
jgi:hypothetical protein